MAIFMQENCITRSGPAVFYWRWNCWKSETFCDFLNMTSNYNLEIFWSIYAVNFQQFPVFLKNKITIWISWKTELSKKVQLLTLYSLNICDDSRLNSTSEHVNHWFLNWIFFKFKHNEIICSQNIFLRSHHRYLMKYLLYCATKYSHILNQHIFYAAQWNYLLGARVAHCQRLCELLHETAMNKRRISEN